MENGKVSPTGGETGDVKEGSEMTETKEFVVVAHGDLDGIVSAALLMNAPYGLSVVETQVVFTQPFLVDEVEIPETVKRVFVVDIAVNNRDTEMTRKFIKKLGDKLVVWYDHHEGWETILGAGMGQTFDNGFFIDPESDSCAQLIEPGNKRFAVWVADANASDTRTGQLSERGRFIEEAMKANLGDDSVRESAVRWIVNGCSCTDKDYQRLQEAQRKHQKIQERTEKICEWFSDYSGVAVIEVGKNDYCDVTQVLLKGEQIAPTKTAVVLGKSLEGEEVITIATMDKEKNLVNLFDLPSGAPFRVSLSVANGWTVEKVIERLIQ